MEKVIAQLIEQISEQAYSDQGSVPQVSLEDIDAILVLFKKALFPGVFHIIEQRDLKTFLETVVYSLSFELQTILTRFDYSEVDAKKMSQTIIQGLPQLRAKLVLDIEAIYQGDPAAKNHEEVILAYPSFEAITMYRIAHQLTKLECLLFARICTSIAHRQTGIDIHPKAVIGDSFCIDHGTGVVIGETSEIGNNVKLYQGVTIGALSVAKSQGDAKRHPTIEDNVTIYAGTTILGGKTVIGAGSIIGGNVWLTESVAPNSKVYHQAS
jgi:serine O-acetyltransferase